MTIQTSNRRVKDENRLLERRKAYNQALQTSLERTRDYLQRQENEYRNSLKGLL